MFSLPQSNGFQFDDILESVQHVDEQIIDQKPTRSPIGHVTIKVREARGLGSRDYQKSTPNPFVVISLGSHKVETSTIENTISPYFGEEFKLECFDQTEEIQIVVMSEHKRYNNFIGRVSVIVRDLIKNCIDGQVEKWYKLMPRNWKEHCTGELHLMLSYEGVTLSRKGSALPFGEIIRDDFSKEYFTMFMSKMNCEEIMELYDQIQEYKNLVRDQEKTDWNNIYNKADTIFHEYIKINAKKEVNLDHSIKEHYFHLFSKDPRSVSLNSQLFGKVEQDLVTQMENIFVEFSTSPESVQLSRQLDWIDQFRNFSQRLEPLSRLVNNCGENDLKCLEHLIAKKRMGVLSFKKPIIHCRAVLESIGDSAFPFGKNDLMRVLKIDHVTELWLVEKNDQVGYIPSGMLTTKILENDDSLLDDQGRVDIMTVYDHKNSGEKDDKEDVYTFLEQNRTKSVTDGVNRPPRTLERKNGSNNLLGKLI